MPDLLVLTLAVAIIAAAGYAVARGADVRLVLLVAAFALAGLRGHVAPVVATFLATFSDEKFVVPICTAMGFAYVLRLTECDRHLVRLLTHPLRSARWSWCRAWCWPGSWSTSRSSARRARPSAWGPVVVPLMRAARMSDGTIGASMLLGASIGGELLNPGAPELNSVAQQINPTSDQVSPTDIVPAVQKLVFIHLALTTVLFWIAASAGGPEGGPAAGRRPEPAARGAHQPDSAHSCRSCRSCCCTSRGSRSDLFHVAERVVAPRPGEGARGATTPG